MRLVAAKTSGSCVGDPHRLGRGEAGHRDIAGAAAEIGHAAFELVAFGERAAVVPEDRRPQRLVVGVEKGRAVHLAGEADAGEPRESVRRVGADRRDRRPRPPSTQSSGFCSLHSGCGRDSESGVGAPRRPLIGVDQQRLDRRRADVEPEKSFADAVQQPCSFPFGDDASF